MIAWSFFARGIALGAAGLTAGAALTLAVTAAAQTTVAPNQPASELQIQIGAARSSTGVPSGEVSCSGQRDPRVTLKCEVRFEAQVGVLGAQVVERGSGRKWSTQYVAFDPALDDTAFFIMIDRSQQARDATVQRAGGELADIFGRIGPRQRVAVATYGTSLDVVQDFTSDANAVTRPLRRARARDAAAELYRLSIEAIGRLQAVTAGRKILIIAGDGKVRGNAYPLEDVVKAARAAGVRIVTLGYAERAVEEPDLQSLRRLSDETGGKFYAATIQNKTLPQEFKSTILTRYGAGVTVEAESPTRDVPAAVEVTIRHPGDLTTQFTATLTAMQPGQQPEQRPPVVTSPGDEPIGFERWRRWLYETFPWLEDNIWLAAGIAAAILVVLIGIIVGLGRRRRPAAPAYVPPPFETPFEAAPPTSSSPFDGGPEEARSEPLHVEPSGERATSIRPVDKPVEVAPLAWLEFNGKPGRVAMRKKRVTIGRQSDNDIVTDPGDDTVSRQHAVITVNTSGRFQLVNKSIETRTPPNPIYVNETECVHAELSDGDMVKLGTGSYGFVFREVREAK